MQKKFCGVCGTKLKPEDKFCSKCGKSLYKSVSDKPDTTNPVACTPVVPRDTQSENTQTTPPAPIITKAEKANTKSNSDSRTQDSQKIKPKTETKPQPINELKKNVITDKVIRNQIGAGGSFFLAIVFLVIGCLGIAGMSIHPGIAIIGGMFLFSGIFNIFVGLKETKQSRKYILVLRECLIKEIHEDDDGNKAYCLYFAGIEGGIGCFVRKVKEEEYNKTEIGDLYYLAIARCKNGTYEVAAYFKETEWCLEGSK